MSALAADSRKVVVYYDYVSPFAYLLSEILPALAAEWRVEVEWRPIELLSLSSFEGGLPYSPRKRAYVAVDALRSATYHGVPIRTPDPFPVRSERALRLASLARGDGGFGALHRALFRAAWRDARDISSESVLIDCLSALSGEPGDWLARAATPQVDASLSAATHDADDAGVFGVPTLALGRELFWGVDSLPALAWRLTAGA